MLDHLKFPIGAFHQPTEISENDLNTWISIIQNFPFRLKLLTYKLTFEQLNWVYRPDGWNIKQVIHHCADSHMNSFVRFKLALTEDNPTIKPYNESAWANLFDGIDNDISSSIKIIEGLHKKWVLLLKSFDESHFSRTFFHPENNKTSRLDEILALYAWHCNHHLAHIELALKHENKF